VTTYVLNSGLKRRCAFLVIKSINLIIKRWFQFSHCELPIHM